MATQARFTGNQAKRRPGAAKAQRPERMSARAAAGPIEKEAKLKDNIA
jgi:hypothetical protein